MRKVLLFLFVSLLVGCAKPLPQAELLIPVESKCTTCEDFIRCDGGSSNAAVYDPSFDIYRLEPKGIVAQLATVWEFLIQLFYTRTEDLRPLSVFAHRLDSTEPFKRVTAGAAEARIDLVQHRIHLPDGWIDQVTGERHGPDDAPHGACRLLAPAEGRALLKLFPEPAAGGKT